MADVRGDGSCGACGPCGRLLERFRAWQYRMYGFWAVLAAMACVGIVALSLAGEGYTSDLSLEQKKAKERATSQLAWISPIALIHLLIVYFVVGLRGRWWPEHRLISMMPGDSGKSTIQAGGIVFAVLVNTLVIRARLKSWLVVVYCFYAFSISRWLLSRVKFEYTMVWVCTTATLVWSKDLSVGSNKLQAILFSMLMGVFIYLGNYLDDYKPPNNEIGDKGKKGWFGGFSDPKEAHGFGHTVRRRHGSFGAAVQRDDMCGDCGGWFESFREWQYRNYGVWATFAVLAGFVIIGTSLSGEGTTPGLDWMSAVIGMHLLTVFVLVGFNGRWWPDNGLVSKVIGRVGKSNIQAGGIVFAVLVSTLVTKAKMESWLVVVYCTYALSVSKWLQFRVKFEYTMVWVCTTATQVWSQDLEASSNTLQAILFSLLMGVFIYLGNYLDGYRPPNKQIHDKGKKGWFGSFEDPSKLAGDDLEEGEVQHDRQPDARKFDIYRPRSWPQYFAGLRFRSFSWYNYRQ